MITYIKISTSVDQGHISSGVDAIQHLQHCRPPILQPRADSQPRSPHTEYRKHDQNRSAFKAPIGGPHNVHVNLRLYQLKHEQMTPPHPPNVLSHSNGQSCVSGVIGEHRPAPLAILRSARICMHTGYPVLHSICTHSTIPQDLPHKGGPVSGSKAIYEAMLAISMTMFSFTHEPDALVFLLL